ncbi:MAG TPA: CHRD domain-containing protein [Opitutales bacterium]|jgi:hypothetical protein|nr:CHRD domain-containing protein [Opitutales bacterium]
MNTIHRFAGIFALVLAMSGCSNNNSPMSADKTDFTAQLSGGEQVPAVATAASGSATFWLNSEGTELHYKLTVSGLNNVTMAHLHFGAFGQNGAPVAWLYPSAPPAKEINGVSNGVLSAGTITAGDLAGPMAGKTIADLAAAIREHNIYVNVHTEAYADGEIRGQLR